MSSLRDLLFHVKEHKFTLPVIEDCLSKLGLKFCGLNSRDLVQHFKETNAVSTDLDNLVKWNSYKEAVPKAFQGMYQFQCQKV